MAVAENSWYKVNRRLLPVKGTYFLVFGATGDLFPFITIYMKQLGLTSTETGIIYGVMPFISFFVRPLFGAIADKTKQHKLFLILCMLMTGLCYGLLLVTPSKPAGTDIRGGVRTHVHCGQIDTFIRDCEDVQARGNRTDVEGHLHMCDMDLHQFSQHYNMTDTYVRCETVCRISMPESVTTQNDWTICFTHDVGTTVSDSCVEYWNSSDSNTDLKFDINNIADILENQILGDNVSYSGSVQTCYSYDIKNVSYNQHDYWQFVCISDVVFDCVLNCGPEYHTPCFSVTTLSKTFWIFMVIFLFCNIFFSPVLSLIDAIAYDILGEKRGQWGRQRNWGTIGFIIFAVTSTFIMDALSKSKQNIDYSFSFYIFVALCVASAVMSYLVQISETFHCSNIFKNLGELFKYPQIVIFLIVVTFFGIFNSVIEAFLFWFLVDLGSSQITLGLSLLFMCIPESIIMFFAGRIMKTIGEVSCIYLATLAFAVRFFAYSFLTNPWYVLPIEILHGFTSGLFYATASAYGSKITPPGMSATVQGLIGGLYFGFGKGIGSLITGRLIDPVSGLGSRWTFRFYGCLAIFLLLTYATIQTVFFREKVDTPKKHPLVKNGQAEEAVDDLLLGTNSIRSELAAFI